MKLTKTQPTVRLAKNKMKKGHLVLSKTGTEKKTLDPNQRDMTVVRQRTLKETVSCEGIGLHGGETVSLVLNPANPDTGIVFHRTDADAVIPARWDHVVDTRMCTVLGNLDGVCVGTVEHLMAALAGCGIDNVEVVLDGPEVPIMDGSSEPFVRLIHSVGVVEQDAPRRVIRVHKEISVAVGDSAASLAPGDCLDLNVEIDFQSKAVSRQSLSVGLMNGSFCKELSRARTFGFLHEVEQLRAAGLAKGGSLENAVVVNGDEILNEEGLRFDDEFVRHKMLDAVGDLYLAGAPIIARFDGARSGHAANNALLRALFADPDAWSYDVIRGDEAARAVDGGLTAESAAAETVA
jgi:UDP-3-O-[3-hydroxymyristoyl] N-acetylglucosamine deacetylase